MRLASGEEVLQAEKGQSLKELHCQASWGVGYRLRLVVVDRWKKDIFLSLKIILYPP